MSKQDELLRLAQKREVVVLDVNTVAPEHSSTEAQQHTSAGDSTVAPERTSTVAQTSQQQRRKTKLDAFVHPFLTPQALENAKEKKKRLSIWLTVKQVEQIKKLLYINDAKGFEKQTPSVLVQLALDEYLPKTYKMIKDIPMDDPFDE